MKRKNRRLPDVQNIRAYPEMQDVPLSHTIFRVGDDRHEPHLHPEDWVIVDTAAREIVFGELYLILQSKGPVLWQITKSPDYIKVIDDERPQAMLCPLAHTAPGRRGPGGIEMPFNVSDGPYAVLDLELDIIGRVVGLIDPDRRAFRKWRENIHASVEREHEAKRRLQGGSP